MRSRDWIAATLVAFFATVGGGVGACKSRSAASKTSADGGLASPAATASGLFVPVVRVLPDAGPLASAIPVPASKVEEAVNPRKLAPYAGPTGVVEGAVRANGDRPPKREITIPFECGEAYATYEKAFREGDGRALADVLVAVTGYDGYVPPSSAAQRVKIHGCAFDRRTVAMTYGQRLEVTNTDIQQSFLPTLLGLEMPAQNVAMPRGDAVKLYPTEVGHYALADGMNRTWMYADVFVLRYPTYAVTGLDGRYRVEGVPVGKVKVSAYLPAIDRDLHPDVGIARSSVEREVEVKAGETTQADFVIPYKQPKPTKAKPPSETKAPIIR